VVQVAESSAAALETDNNEVEAVAAAAAPVAAAPVAAAPVAAGHDRPEINIDTEADVVAVEN